MTTTAEGVETQEQLDQMRAEGCTEAQGFYYGRPMPANEIAQLLSATEVSGRDAPAVESETGADLTDVDQWQDRRSNRARRSS